MAKIHSIHIENFRGIKKLDQTFFNEQFVVLIGRGDSGKTTILNAISYVLSPNWNINISDFDFYNSDINENIVIEVAVGDLPKDLLTEQKFGHYINLLKGDTITSDIDDDDADQENPILRIRLTIDSTLEPKWVVCSGRDIGDIAISASDRAKLNMFFVSDYIDKHFTYSKGSPLYTLLRQQLDDLTITDKKLTQVVRESYEVIKQSNTFSEFDAASIQILDTAKKLGLTISELKTLLEFKENAYTESNITLHSQDRPYKLHGKGSKRLLSIAIQQSLIGDGGIMLIDEIEQGLESDRVRNLTRLLCKNGTGQIFITTHSKDVVLEPEITSIYLKRNDSDTLYTFPDNFQGIMRGQPAAFFAKRIICCEGATEEGIIRAISDSIQEKRGFGIAVQGIVHIDCGGGDKFYEQALKFSSAKYDTMVFCDDDNRDIDKSKEKALRKGIKVVLCDEGKSIEQQLFNDLPWQGVCDLIDYAIREHGDKVLQNSAYNNIDEIKKLNEEEQVNARIYFGGKAKTAEHSWFKRIHHGEAIGQLWIKYYNELSQESTLKKEYDEIIKWIGNEI